jgi:type I restriction enzyme S subunit
MKNGKKMPVEEVCKVEYGTRVVQKRDGGSAYPVYGGGGATFKMDEFNREDRMVIARFGMSEECTRFVAGKFFLNDSGLTVSPKNGAMLQRFLDYQMLSLNDDIYALGKGTAQKNLDVPVFRTLTLYIPYDTKEQQRIVGILDEAFEHIATAKANAEKNLQNARALFESHLQSVFTQAGKGWVERRLWEVFEIGSSKRIRETEWTSTGVPFYGGKEIVRLAKFGSTVSTAYISEEKYRDYASKYDMPRKGDILITARGTIGVGYVVKEGDKFYYKDGNIISFREKTPTNARFVLYAFRSKPLVDQFADLTGATVKHLPIERAKDLILKMPTFATQNSVVSNLENIEKEAQRLESIYQRKLAVLEALKTSLLHQAFAGNL